MRSESEKILNKLSSPRNATMYGLADNIDWDGIKDFAGDCGFTQSEMISILWGEFNDKYQDFTREQVISIMKDK